VHDENRMAGTGSRAACGTPMPPCIGPVFVELRILAGGLVCDRFYLPASIRARPGPAAHAMRTLPGSSACTVILRQVNKYKAALALCLGLFQVGAIALQYAPDTCDAVG
jgi:hypothetical protein